MHNIAKRLGEAKGSLRVYPECLGTVANTARSLCLIKVAAHCECEGVQKQGRNPGRQEQVEPNWAWPFGTSSPSCLARAQEGHPEAG